VVTWGHHVSRTRTSQTSSYDWLRSIDGCELLLQLWRSFGVDLSQLSGTSGGVPDGMP
jgi:hypothetical protein